MSPLSIATRPSRILSIAPWLQLLGSVQMWVIISVFTVIHSPLGKEITPGESPGLAWAGDHRAVLLFFSLGYLFIALGLQHLAIRRSHLSYPPGIVPLVSLEGAGIAVLAVAFFHPQEDLWQWGHLLLPVSLLLQALLVWGPSAMGQPDQSPHVLPRAGRGTYLFLLLLFVIAAAQAFGDPSWKRMEAHVRLDGAGEVLGSRIFPPLLSGVVSFWHGIGMLALVSAVRPLAGRHSRLPLLDRKVPFWLFLTLLGFPLFLWLKSLLYAIDWEVRTLHLHTAIVPLFILLWISGGILAAGIFRRIVSHGPPMGERSMVGIVSLTAGSVFLLPLSWALTRRGFGLRSWRLLLSGVFGGSLLAGSYLLYGNLLNPWFTAFSYWKGAGLMTSAIVAAGTLVLIFEELFPRGLPEAGKTGKEWIIGVILFSTGFIPFAALEIHRDLKVFVLQFHELSWVNAAYGRMVSTSLGLDRWIRLGQDPKRNDGPDPWPRPWTLKKTHPSILPWNFNLLVIVVDALRGDAFASAGYERNLTPFLDSWAKEEAVSFRRAYSQGGGSFASFPFLIAGRSRLDLYGPGIGEENLYFKIAQAEGIRNLMLVKDGPRGIFPPDAPVMELGRGKSGPPRRSPAADEVFGWAREAIGKLDRKDRFLCFLHLMDVHNDLWKKEEGLDLGDRPRDLYDNNLSYVDRAFERFIVWLKEEGLYRRTVILFTSDHGEQFWEHGASLHGHTVYEEEIRIPLILLAHGIRGRFED
ncbi:MAG: sulfatase-like hydrolase/transferase, partial [Planctomycetaceae bacterium]